VSIVADTWDYWKVLTEILPALKDEIMARDGMVVTRPDSGDPADIICGNPDVKPGSPEFKGSFELLYDTFGGPVNDKNYKHLDSHVGLIYGEAINLARTSNICSRLERKKFVPSMVLGIGSYQYQMNTRDTFGFALKSTAGVVNGELREIFKDPVTDDGTKKSAKGLLAVDHNLKMRQVKTFEEVKDCAFVNVFHNGSVSKTYTLTDIRERIKG
jgi:nicotinamide phosphoribosyltransferase